jgi:hypothetical protein
MQTATPSTATIRLLRLEAVAALAVAVVFYQLNNFSWWLFAICFLLPDLSLLGYLAGARVGAVAYNAVHAYCGPLLLGMVCVFANAATGMAVATIWFAHIAFDRTLGFGLKDTSGFHSTHLGAIGRP